MAMLGLQELLVVLIIGIVFVLPFWRIFSKAGFSGWLSLAMVVPVLNFIAVCFLAFAEWPIRRNLDSAGAGAND
jgi:hypothetical protein